VTKFADLHIHTFYSDGTSSPAEVVEEALKAGLSCIAITDHDTLEGIPPTQLAAQGSDLEVIAAIELSSEIHDKDIHILGYFLDLTHTPFKEELLKMRAARVERIRHMIEKLKILGINNIAFEEVADLGKFSIGRPHLAAILKEKGWVGSIPEAFEKYLGEDGPAYVKKFKVSPYEAIALIRQAGGVAVLAHPMVTGKDELIPSFVEAGLEGLEVYYPNYSETAMKYYEGLAKKHNLVTTGGSDAHGKVKPNTFIGKARVPYEIVEKLKERAAKVR